MAGVTKHCTDSEKKLLFCFGNDANLQAALGHAVAETLSRFACVYSASTISAKASWKTELPPGVDPYAFFTQRSGELKVELHKPRKLVFAAPGFMHEPVLDRYEASWRRACLLMPTLRNEVTSNKDPDIKDKENDRMAAIAFALSYRSALRRIARYQYENTGTGILTADEWNLQTAIWRCVRSGLPLPENLPASHLSFFEEDLAWFYSQRRKNWIGYQRWHKKGFLHFEPSPTTVGRLHL